MVADLSIRPIGTSVVTPVAVSPAPESAKSAVPTQLPPAQAVTASAKADQPKLPDTQYFDHQVTIDRAAAAVVYQVVDNRTNVVVNQFPDEVRLRARAYFRAQDEAKLRQSEQKTDRRA